jgi:archaellum biogenesis ATPase FlaH
MAQSALAQANSADQARWGAEAIEAFLPIAKAARSGKDDDPNLDVHIDVLASTFMWRFINARKTNTTMKALENVVPLRRPESKKPARPPGLLKLTWIHETEDDDEREWLVYGMFAKGEMSVVFGEPSAGKSIIAGDIALHVAQGMPWFGLETSKTIVLYYAAERAKLVKRRLRGLEDYHERDDVTKVIIGSGALDIRSERDTRLLINDIKRASDDAGENVGLVIIDTFSRSLNGGDENSQSDVGDAVKNMQKIVDETGVHLMAIHHVGVSLDAKKRMRGSSVLTGAIDKSFLVTQPKKRRDHHSGGEG